MAILVAYTLRGKKPQGILTTEYTFIRYVI